MEYKQMTIFDFIQQDQEIPKRKMYLELKDLFYPTIEYDLVNIAYYKGIVDLDYLNYISTRCSEAIDYIFKNYFEV